MKSVPQQARLPELGSRVPRLGNIVSRAIGRFVFAMFGWRLEGDLPNLPKYIVVAAPHTSNWDAILGFAGLLGLQLRANTMVKSDAFIGPLGWLLRLLGAIPIDRKSPKGIVEQTADAFAARDQMILLITPEGTRQSSKDFKRGFHRVALAAQVPIVLAAVNYQRRAALVSEPFHASEDFDGDCARILDYFQRQGCAKHVDRLSLPLRDSVDMQGLQPIALSTRRSNELEEVTII